MPILVSNISVTNKLLLPQYSNFLISLIFIKKVTDKAVSNFFKNIHEESPDSLLKFLP